MIKSERIKEVKTNLIKDMARLERLIDSSNKKSDFKSALEVMKLYFLTKDKIANMLSKVYKL